MLSKLLLLFPMLFFCVVSSVSAQLDTFTPEERNAVEQMGDRFRAALKKEGRVETLVPELFVPEFAAEYIEDEVFHFRKPEETVVLVPGIEYRAGLLKTATEDDWRRLLIATYNFMRSVEVPLTNKVAAVHDANGGSVSTSDFSEVFDTVIPKTVVDLFAKEPMLKDFIQRNKDSSDAKAEPMRTPEDLRRVVGVLERAAALMTKASSPQQRTFSPAALEFIRELLKKDRYAPYAISSGLTTFYATPMEELKVKKVDGKFKIVFLRIALPN